MTESNDPKTAATLPRPADAGEPDPLSGLYKMSTTAGVSSQEYVAINIPSIVALALSLASIVAVLHPVLMVVPLAAIVTAAFALQQIRDSNGTQTGRGFAWLAVAISLAIGGYKLVASVADRVQTRADRQAIAARLEEVGRLVRDKQYDKAYALFSARFRNRINPQTFEAKWEGSQSYRELGRITAIEWNRTNIQFVADPSSGAKVGYAASWIRFEKAAEPARYTFEFRKSGPTWEVDDIPSLFPTDKPPTRRRQSPGA